MARKAYADESWGGGKPADGKTWRAASYARLSVDDGDGGQSTSIVNQQRIIRSHVETRSDMILVSEFVDDGWSGSSFERPGFKAMMAAIETGLVDCVVVKDLSRFGRNYLQAGEYLERIFPAMGVRLVAVADGYDSLREGGLSLGLSGDDALLVPFKNLINDWYCASTSAKTRDALEARRLEGVFVGAFAPYGYVKVGGALEEDPESAPVVRRVFELRAAGRSLCAIADELNADGVPSPAALKRARGCARADGVAAPLSDTPKWHASQIRKMLANEMYAGVLTQGKTFAPSFRSGVRLKVLPENWARVPGACPALVSRELFEAAQAACTQNGATAAPVRAAS